MNMHRRLFASLALAAPLLLAACAAPAPAVDPAARAALAPTGMLRVGVYQGSPSSLVRDPKIILLDEPFEGLAPVIVRDLVKACRDLAAAGQTIVLVEQNLAASLALASRVYIINNGHIAHEAPAADLKANPEILHRYLGV